jgi:hypothetical protein
VSGIAAIVVAEVSAIVDARQMEQSLQAGTGKAVFFSYREIIH